MPKPTEHFPGEAAPAAGTYVLLSVFGTPTPIRIVVTAGARLPSAPLGHSWMLTHHAVPGEQDPAG